MPITRYHYILNIDHDGSDKAREAVDRIRNTIMLKAFSRENTKHLTEWEFDFDQAEDVTKEHTI